MNDPVFYTYILASSNGVALYIGSTNNLPKRLYEHKNEVVPSHTRDYHIHKLVYYETHATREEALIHERRYKRWRRDWKNDMITKFNPRWEDLYTSICA